MPIVKEMEGEAGWDAWSAAVQQQEAAFAPTAPAPLSFPATEPAALEPGRDARAGAKAAREITLEQAMQEARKHGRVCPQPAKWQSLYGLLAANAKDAPLPVAPLTGPAWDRTPVMSKRQCFREQLEWAAAQGCLPAVDAFLRSLGEADWHTAG